MSHLFTATYMYNTCIKFKSSVLKGFGRSNEWRYAHILIHAFVFKYCNKLSATSPPPPPFPLSLPSPTKVHVLLLLELWGNHQMVKI